MDGAGFQCGVCKQIKKTQRGLSLHITRYCGKTNPLKCGYCSDMLPNDKQLRSHIYQCPSFAASCYRDVRNRINEPPSASTSKLLEENNYDAGESGVDTGDNKLITIRCPRTDSACLKYYKLMKKLERMRATDALRGEKFALQKDILHFMTITELWNLPKEACSQFIRWARTLGGRGSHLPSYHMINKYVLQAVTLQGPAVNFKTMIRVPMDSKYTRTTDNYVDFHYRDIVEAACTLITRHVKTEDDMMWTQNIQYAADGSGRVFTPELNTGEWYERTENTFFGKPNSTGMTLLPLIVFIDDTNVTQRGTQTAKPIVVTVGSFREELRQKKEAWVECGYLPKLESQSLKKSQDFKDAKARLYNECLKAFFKPLEDAAKGFYLEVLGEASYFVPCVAFFCQDSKEGDALAGVLSGYNCKFPCRMCATPCAEISNPFTTFFESKRNQVEAKQIATQAFIAIKVRLLHMPLVRYVLYIIHTLLQGRDKVMAARQRANDKSLHPRINPLWDIPLGEQKDGIFSAVPPELLHQYGLGMEKYCFEYTWAFIKLYYEREKIKKRVVVLKEELDPKRHKEVGSPVSVKVEGQHKNAVKAEHSGTSQHHESRHLKGFAAPQNKWTTELDHRISMFRTRHSDMTMPRSKFPIGSYNLPFLQSKEYKALLYQMIVAIGERSAVLPPPISHKIQAVMWKIVDIHVRLWEQEGHNDNGLHQLHDDIVTMMADFKETYGEKSIAASECSFLKFHLNLHLTATIREFGSMRIVDTSFGESNNKDVKKIFLRTNRQRRHSAQMMLSASSRRRTIMEKSEQQGIEVRRHTVRRKQVDSLRGQRFCLRGDQLNPPLKLKAGVKSFLVDLAATADFSLYTSLGITADSENSVIYHAAPDINGEPWYDNGLILVEEEDSESDRVVYNVGEFQAFLAIDYHGEVETKISALLHLYCARPSNHAAPRKHRSKTIYDVYHPDSMTTVPDVPLPVMQFAYNPDGTPTLYLVDTESIQSAVWMQQDFDTPAYYWCIRHRASNE